MLRYRSFTDADYEALQALDIQQQQATTPHFDALPERERQGRLCTSQTALKFYERSEHSFLAEDAGGKLRGFLLAQSVWQGDRPMVLVRAIVTEPQDSEAMNGLLHACVKSAYDAAVYEVHLAVTPALLATAYAEEGHITGQYGVIHLGTRAESAPGEKLRKIASGNLSE